MTRTAPGIVAHPGRRPLRFGVPALLLILTGCATPRPDPPESPLSTLPTLGSPTAPPKSPTDPRPDNVVAGMVTADGSGPCYQVRTDDGTDYALYGTGGWTVHKGDVVRATVTSPGVVCPGGRAVGIVTFEVL